MASLFGYTTADNIKTLIPQIDQSESFDTDTEIEFYITRQESIVNSKLGIRYIVPFTSPIPTIITHITEQLTIYQILRTEYTEDSVNLNEWVKTYNEIMNLLDDIADGKEILKDDNGDELEENSDIVLSNRDDYTPIFDLDDVLEQRVDPDLLEEIKNER